MYGLFSFAGSLQNWLAHFLFMRSYKDIIRNKHFSSYFINYGSAYGSKGTVVNRALSSLHGGSRKNTLTVPLILGC